VTGQSFFSAAYHKRGEKYDGVDYCFDDATWAALKAKTDTGANNPDAGGYMISYQTQYILRTAGNWQGPIGRFHLTLDKQKPGNLMSLCWDGELKKTGPTTFEFVREKFAPTRDIDLMVLETAGPIEE
jgi:hypothetical protein